MSRHPVYDRVKRLADFVLAAVLIVLLGPLLLLVALAIRISMGSPVLFRQQRPGRGGRPFELLKFRTMSAAAPGTDAIEAVATDARRLTTIGRLLRSTSLDELPQLINVLRGDMSFVGPRPLLMEYLGHYSPRQAMRHDVTPGITGWAQVNGRNAISWDERLEMDAWYAENYSALLDLRIALMTVGAVFSRRGVSAEGQATVRPFVEPHDSSGSEDE